MINNNKYVYAVYYCGRVKKDPNRIKNTSYAIKKEERDFNKDYSLIKNYFNTYKEAELFLIQKVKEETQNFFQYVTINYINKINDSIEFLNKHGEKIDSYPIIIKRKEDVI